MQVVEKKVDRKEESLKKNPAIVKKLEHQLEENINLLKLVREIIIAEDRA